MNQTHKRHAIPRSPSQASYGVPIVRLLENTDSAIMAPQCICCIIWITWHYNHNQVSMMVADVLAPIWCQDICNHHDDLGTQASPCHGCPSGVSHLTPNYPSFHCPGWISYKLTPCALRPIISDLIRSKRTDWIHLSHNQYLIPPSGWIDPRAPGHCSPQCHELFNDLNVLSANMSTNRVCHLLAIAGGTKLVTYHFVMSLQFILRSSTHR